MLIKSITSFAILVLLSGCYINSKSNQSFNTPDILGEYEIDSTTNPCFSFYDSTLNSTIHYSPMRYTKRIYLKRNNELRCQNITQNDSPTWIRDIDGNEIIYTRSGTWQVKKDTLILNFELDKKVEQYLMRSDSLISVNAANKTIWVKDHQ
jgi:hypothetical protein